MFVKTKQEVISAHREEADLRSRGDRRPGKRRLS